MIETTKVIDVETAMFADERRTNEVVAVMEGYQQHLSSVPSVRA
jgi:hypothetical protein